MAFQAAPDTTANNANQNSAEQISSMTVLPLVFSSVYQAAPLTTAVNLGGGQVGYSG